MSRKPLIVPWHGTPSPEEIEVFCHQVHEELGDLIYRAASVITRNRHMAEEAVQEGQIALLHALNDGKLNGNVASWLLKTVCNRAHYHVRHAGIRQHLDVDEMADGLPAAPLPTQEEIDACAAARSHWQDLPDQMRRAIELKAEGGRTYAEIGAMIGCEAETARKYCIEARKRLRNAIGRKMQE